MVKKKLNEFEFKRQIAHILFGVIVLWGIHFDIFTVITLGVSVFLLLFFIILVKKGQKIIFFSHLLSIFERPEHFKEFPGRGLFFFVLGTFLCFLFFGKYITMASVSILLVGDAITNLAGIHFGRIENPLNKDKTVEGTLFGIVASLMTCILFFPFIPSLVASCIAMIAEIPQIKIKKFIIDDNLTIALSAGFVLYLFSL